MITITPTAAGIRITRGADAPIDLATAAIPSALGPIIVALTASGAALGAARREGYEAGLARGREQARIEHETSARIAQRQEADMIADLLASLTLAHSA